LLDHGEGVYVAGGCVRTLLTGEQVTDIDFFFRDRESLESTRSHLLHHGARLIFKCPRNELFTYEFKGYKVQLICKRFYTSLGELLDSFDFTICRFGFVLADVVMLERANLAKFLTRDINDYNDLQRRVLRVHRIEYPVASLNRVHKYMKKGFVPYNTEDFFIQLVMAVKTAPLDEEHLALYID
jgi:tRNA nucleotidyltransferase/poly(A) polymerase